ncbi:hypothetical protein GS831_15285, partial [Rhodococcus hoagii]|nr:hypothetical protein [Prescottella equi]
SANCSRSRTGSRVRGYWGEAVTTAEEATELLAHTGAHALGGDLFVDGALGSHAAHWSSRTTIAPAVREPLPRRRRGGGARARLHPAGIQGASM